MVLKKLRTELLELAKKNDIEVISINNIGDDGSDTAFPFIRKIIMNENFKTGYSYEYRLAHELSHILFGDMNNLPLYKFSPYFHDVEEISANINAVNLISTILYADTPIEYRNWVDFMDILGLQSHFEHLVKEALYE